MRFLLCSLAVVILMTATPSVVAVDASQGDQPKEQVHRNLYAAVKSQAMAKHEPVLIEPMVFENGYGYYRLRGYFSGEETLVLVSLDAPPFEPGPTSVAEKAAYNVIGGSNRCIIRLYKNTYYGTLIQTTDIDWSNLSAISGVNDQASSIQTTCNGAWFFRDANYTTSNAVLYVPANTNLPTLNSDMNDRISAFLHDLD